MLGGIPVVGSVYKALTGQVDYHAQAPRIGTKAGTEAIRQQTALASRRAAQGSYSLAASARGPGAALAAREAQRRGALAHQAGIEQAGIAQQNLIQGTNALNAQNQMQAQQINAGIAQHNASGLSNLAGAALSGGALMMLSDRDAKMQAFQAGALAQHAAQQQPAGGPFGNLYGSQMAGHEDGRRVQWVSGPQAMTPQMTQQAEMDRVQRDANAAGVTLSPGDWQAMGYQTSDERAKVAEDENKLLRAAVGSLARSVRTGMSVVSPGVVTAVAPRAPLMRSDAVRPPPDALDRQKAAVNDEASAARYGAEWLKAQGRADALEQVRQLREQQAVAAAREKLSMAEANRSMGDALSQRTSAEMVESDKHAKMEMEFPAGVKPRVFAYKPGMGPPGEEPGEVNVGLYAQDLEKSPEGATVVEEDPSTGMKMVNTPKLTMLVTGKLAEMDARLKRMEGRKRA